MIEYYVKMLPLTYTLDAVTIDTFALQQRRVFAAATLIRIVTILPLLLQIVDMYWNVKIINLDGIETSRRNIIAIKLKKLVKSK